MLPAFPAKYRWTLGAFLIVLAATWWRPLYPVEQALHPTGRAGRATYFPGSTRSDSPRRTPVCGASRDDAGHD